MKVAVTRALISVYDKTGLETLAKTLDEAGVELVSSGGTAQFLRDLGYGVTDVMEVTEFPEMLDGRVKTLHPRIHGGVLANMSMEDHRRQLSEHGIDPFQLVVSNLYPFTETVSVPNATEPDIIEKIDIGGPALVRAAAKNHAHVGVVTSPDQYDRIVAAVESGGLSAELRLDLARAAFAHTAAYDAAVATWFQRDTARPEQIAITLKAVTPLRYGENPHQEAVLYSDGTPSWWSEGNLLQGKEMSFNNFVDTEAAYRLANSLPAPGAVVVKHTNPAGAAVGESVSDAFAKAWAGDPVAAFGGVIAANVPVDKDTAELIVEYFVEIVIAPSIEIPAREVFAKKPNIRVMSAPPPAHGGREVRFIEGGALVQDRDRIDTRTWRQVAPGSADRRDLEVAWVVAGHTKSNAVVLVREGQVVGAGAGDQSRIGAVQRALSIAGERSRGAVAASDAFFPFRDGLDALAEAGVAAVVEPGGSRNDDEVINAAVEHGLALFFTERRHFLH